MTPRLVRYLGFPSLVMAATLGPLAICTSHAQGSALNTDSCALTTPPSDSASSLIHGTKWSVFPAKLGPRYTGCRTTWIADPWIMMRVVRYIDGVPSMVIERKQLARGGGIAELTCFYANGSNSGRTDVGYTSGMTCPTSSELQEEMALDAAESTRK
jgi:hypothetical protein